MNTRINKWQEQPYFTRFSNAITSGRKSIRGMIAGVSLLGQLDLFRRLQIESGYSADLFPVISLDTVREQAQTVLDSWNKLEFALGEVHGQRAAIRVVPEKNDIDVVLIRQDTELSGWFLVVVGAAAVVYVAYAISDAIKTREKSKRLATDYAEKVLQFDKSMATAPEPVRAAYEQLRKTHNYKEEKSLLDSLVGGLGSAAGGGIALLLGGLALYAWSRSKK